VSAPRASLRVAHRKGCPNESRSSLDSVGRKNGCTCEASFYTFYRDAAGKVVKGAMVDERGKIVPGGRIADRKVAQASLDKLNVTLSARGAGVETAPRVTFHEWCEEFLAITGKRVNSGELKRRTLESYRITLDRAQKAIADIPLDRIGAAELRAFDDLFSENSDATRLQHRRHLSACLAAAVDEDLLDRNPMKVFSARSKLKAPKRGKAPFDDSELERLWVAFRSYEPVYGFAARFSAESGLRLGELVALDWPNVDLTGRKVYVEHTWDPGAGELVRPKDGETRWVYLTAEAAAVLEEWVAVAGVRDAGPVFPNPIGGGRMVHRQAQRRLGNAMDDAGVPKVHPELRLPRTFHSLRYSTSVLMQRRGYHPRLIESNLGHSSLELTYGVYGGWTPEMLAAEAARPVASPGDGS
jgi:integrase